MGRRGLRPQEKVNVAWRPELAYAIGLLSTDGSLSSDGRHIDFTSNDLEQVQNLVKCLNLKNMIGKKRSGTRGESFRVQFGDVKFYRFLLDLGLMPNKSLILKNVEVPEKYFFDFLRGHFDGDGTFYEYHDKRWRSSYSFSTYFYSASEHHVHWLRKKIRKKIGIKGQVFKPQNDSVYHLKYAKAESLKLLPKLYYDSAVVCLSRKRLKVEKALKGMVNFSEFARVAKLADALP